MYKNPRKLQFIIAAANCSLKPVSKPLAAVFKMRFHQTENHNNHLSFFSEIEAFWTILNNQPVIKSIANIAAI